MNRYAIIVAGGQGQRLGSELPKQFLPLNGRPVLFHSIEKFLNLANEIILVLPAAHVNYWKELNQSAGFDTNIRIVEGGETRSSSVFNGLLALKGSGTVAIHDAVRPLVSRELVEKLFAAAEKHGNAVPAVPVRESMRKKAGDGNQAVQREEYLSVQTPQCFDLQSIINSYHHLGEGLFTDDASVFEQHGGKIHLVAGENTNIKITFREDFLYAEAVLRALQM